MSGLVYPPWNTKLRNTLCSRCLSLETPEIHGFWYSACRELWNLKDSSIRGALSCLPEDHGGEKCLAHPRVAFLSMRTMDRRVCCISSETLIGGRFFHCFPHVQGSSHLVEFKRYLSLQFPFVNIVGLGVIPIRQDLKRQVRPELQPEPSPEETLDYCEYIITNGVLTEKNRKYVQRCPLLAVEPCLGSWKSLFVSWTFQRRRCVTSSWYMQEECS